jgi:hypothetical protein
LSDAGLPSKLREAILILEIFGPIIDAPLKKADVLSFGKYARFALGSIANEP